MMLEQRGEAMRSGEGESVGRGGWFFALFETVFLLVFLVMIGSLFVSFSVLLGKFELITLAFVMLLASCLCSVLPERWQKSLREAPMVGGAVRLYDKLELQYKERPPWTFLYYLFFPITASVWFLFSGKARRELRAYAGLVQWMVALLAAEGIASYFRIYKHFDAGFAWDWFYLELLCIYFLCNFFTVPMATTTMRLSMQGKRYRLFISALMATVILGGLTVYYAGSARYKNLIPIHMVLDKRISALKALEAARAAGQRVGEKDAFFVQFEGLTKMFLRHHGPRVVAFNRRNFFKELDDRQAFMKRLNASYQGFLAHLSKFGEHEQFFLSFTQEASQLWGAIFVPFRESVFYVFRYEPGKLKFFVRWSQLPAAERAAFATRWDMGKFRFSEGKRLAQLIVQQVRDLAARRQAAREEKKRKEKERQQSIARRESSKLQALESTADKMNQQAPEPARAARKPMRRLRRKPRRARRSRRSVRKDDIASGDGYGGKMGRMGRRSRRGTITRKKSRASADPVLPSAPKAAQPAPPPMPRAARRAPPAAPAMPRAARTASPAPAPSAATPRAPSSARPSAVRPSPAPKTPNSAAGNIKMRELLKRGRRGARSIESSTPTKGGVVRRRAAPRRAAPRRAAPRRAAPVAPRRPAARRPVVAPRRPVPRPVVRPRPRPRPRPRRRAWWKRRMRSLRWRLRRLQKRRAGKDLSVLRAIEKKRRWIVRREWSRFCTQWEQIFGDAHCQVSSGPDAFQAMSGAWQRMLSKLPPGWPGPDTRRLGTWLEQGSPSMDRGEALLRRLQANFRELERWQRITREYRRSRRWRRRIFWARRAPKIRAQRAFSRRFTKALGQWPSLRAALREEGRWLTKLRKEIRRLHLAVQRIGGERREVLRRFVIYNKRLREFDFPRALSAKLLYDHFGASPELVKTWWTKFYDFLLVWVFFFLQLMMPLHLGLIIYSRWRFGPLQPPKGTPGTL